MPIVGDGDCAVSIAEDLGFFDYHSLWDDGANAGLKATRPNPNQLLAGDDVKPPAVNAKAVAKPTDKTVTVVVKKKKLPKLRLVVLDHEGKPMSGKTWTLTTPVAASGTLKGNGLIEVPGLDPAAKAGDLSVVWRKTPAAPKEEKEAKITDPVYPRPVKAKDFTDAKVPLPDPADNTIQWTLKIGSLPTFDATAGVQARLHNLGYRCDPDGNSGATKASVDAYQRSQLKQDKPSGATADIQAGLRDSHDN